MSPLVPKRRFAVLTPGARGADGISELSRLVIRALDSFDVDVLSLADPMDSQSGELGHGARRVFGAGGSRLRFFAAGIRALLAGRRYTDVLCLHLHLSPLGKLLALRGARLVTVLCGVESWKVLRRRERRALDHSEILIAISDHTAQRFREANPQFRHRQLRVCRPALREGTGSASLPRPDSTLDPSPRPFALIVGRMMAAERYKGHDCLIDIWPRVMAEIAGAHLVVVGDGDDRRRLEEKAARWADNIMFLGLVSDVALARIYRDCAFFVMPSREEGFGLVFLEAMRAGKACIGGLGAPSEIIDDGVTGIVVDPKDPEEVLKAVLELYREREIRERMGRAGAARVAREFSEVHFRRRLRSLLGIASGR